jgi:sodium/proline symporter
MNILITTFSVYSLLILFITVAAYRQTHTHADYILGNRSFNAMITAMGVAASDMSAWLMQGVPATIYMMGLGKSWLLVSILVGGYLNWLFVAPRLRTYTEVASNSLTLPAYFENRFAMKAGYLRYIAALFFVIFFTIYASSGFVGAAKLLVTAADMDYTEALWISGPLIIAYCVVGGYFAVNWVDLFQGTLMLVALVIVPAAAIFGYQGGFDSIMTQIATIAPEKTSFFNIALDISFFTSLAWGLGYFGQPHILVRFMSARDEKAIKYGRRICTSWMIIALSSAVATGFVGIAYFPLGSLPTPEAVLPALVKSLLNPWAAGLILAAIISAIVSTLAAVLMAAGSALINDFYKHRFRPNASQTELVWVGRFCVAVIAICAFLMADHPNPSVMMLVSHAWGGLGATFGPVVLVSLFYRNMTCTGALFGMLFGAITALVWAALGYTVGGIFELYELLPGFIMGMIGALWGCRFSHPNHKSIELFDLMKTRMKEHTQ